MQEYERAVIFRLGRLVKGGAKGPGELPNVQNGKVPSSLHPFFIFLCRFSINRNFHRNFLCPAMYWYILSSRLENKDLWCATTRIEYPLRWTFHVSVSLPSRFFSFELLQVLTKDSVTVSVDAVVYYRVSNATVSIANVENAHQSTRLLAQTTLRNTMGTRQLHEILSERMTLSGGMQVSWSDIKTIFM